MTAASSPAGWRDDVALFIDPVTYHFEQDRLFDLATSRHGGDDVLAPYLHLRAWMAERGVRVHTADLLGNGAPLAERNVYVSLGMRHRYERLAARADVIPSAFLALECPIVEPGLYLDLYDASKAFRRTCSYSTAAALAPFLSGPVTLERFMIPQSFDAVHEEVWRREERSFLVMINANKLPRLSTAELYSERLRAVDFFGSRGEIDLYGVNWDGPPYRMGATRVPVALQRAQRGVERAWRRLRPDPLLAAARRAWHGPVEAKAATLGRYRFAICFENMELEGWITEKLFDCLFAGTVPVYLGATDIERWVPQDCFVDMRRFAGFGELRAFLHDLSPADVRAYREAGREFVGSERFAPFSKHTFTERFGRFVEEDTGTLLERRTRLATPPATRSRAASTAR